MSCKIASDVELETMNGFPYRSTYEVDDVRRLSVYATVRSKDFKTLRELKGGQKPKDTGVSLQELFVEPKLLQYRPDDTIQEETSSTESLPRVGDEDTAVVSLTVTDELGIQYHIDAIKKYEFPVIGFHIDGRVCPGFRYNVRYLGTDRQVFDDGPHLLQSIGMGYGKRLTFKGDRPSTNECFWTDNNPEGYGFSISCIDKGDNFMIYDSTNQLVGEVKVMSVIGPQIEEAMKACNGEVTKLIRVRFLCSVHYHGRYDHNLYDIASNDMQTVEGLAEVVKAKKSKEAVVVRIKDVDILKIGHCTLWNDAL